MSILLSLCLLLGPMGVYSTTSVQAVSRFAKDMHSTKITTTGNAALSPSNTVTSNCNGCYGTAGVSQVVFGSYVTQTLDLGSFTWTLSNLNDELFTDAPAPTNNVLPTANVITFNYQSITNPTVYNLITAYQVWGSLQIAGKCRSQLLTNVWNAGTAMAQIPSGSDTSAMRDAIYEAELQFISALPQMTCTQRDDGALTLIPRVPASAISALPTSTISEETVTETTTGTTSTISTVSEETVTETSTNTVSRGTDSASAAAATTIAALKGASSNLQLRIGLGVGISVGSVVLCTVLVVLLTKLRSRRLKARGFHAIIDSEPVSELPSRTAAQELQNNIAAQEVHNTTAPQELCTERPAEMA